MFQFIDADEGRSVNDNHINGSSRSKYGSTGNGLPGQRIETAPARKGVGKQSESKRGADLISGVLLFVNFLGEFPRSSAHLFVCVLAHPTTVSRLCS